MKFCHLMNMFSYVSIFYVEINAIRNRAIMANPNGKSTRLIFKVDNLMFSLLYFKIMDVPCFLSVIMLITLRHELSYTRIYIEHFVWLCKLSVIVKKQLMSVCRSRLMHSYRICIPVMRRDNASYRFMFLQCDLVAAA